MKKYLIISLFINFIFVNRLYSQKEILLTDTAFQLHDYYRTREIKFAFSSNSNCSFDTSFSIQIHYELEKIAKFLLSNPHIVVEVGVHNNYRPTKSSSQSGECWPSLIISELINLGVPQKQMIGRNYFGEFPLIGYEEIKQMNEKAQIESFNYNKRVDFKIIKI